MSLSDAPAPGMRDVAPFPAPPAPHPAGTAHDGLQARLLRAGREAVDDRELLQLLLTGSHPAADWPRSSPGCCSTPSARPPGSSPRAPTRCARSPGSASPPSPPSRPPRRSASRWRGPRCPRPSIPSSRPTRRSSSIAAPWRPTATWKMFRALYLDTKNRLIRDELLQTGTINHTPVYPRQVCVRALEVGAAALVVVHQHPLG